MNPLRSLISSWKNDRTRARHRDGWSRAGATRTTSRRQRPCLEPLEGRALLTTYNVNSFSDWNVAPPGTMTLRIAIRLANQNSDDDTIVLPAGIYKLHLGELHITHVH